jgi:hypothetical protein
MLLTTIKNPGMQEKKKRVFFPAFLLSLEE